MSDTNAHAGEQVNLESLSWCVEEIRSAFAACQKLLEAAIESASEPTGSLRQAAGALHQAQGALTVLDLTGPGLLLREAEALLEDMAAARVDFSSAVASRLNRSLTAVTEYLDELLAGGSSQPLYLFPYYRMLVEARGIDRINPAELFDPGPGQLSLPAVQGVALNAEQRKRVHSHFELGLLELLRCDDPKAGAQRLQAAVKAVRLTELGTRDAQFWFLIAAMFEGVAADALTVDVYFKRLLARLNLQLRKTLVDGAPLSSGLSRDLLFSIARARQTTPLIRQVFEAWSLVDSVPDDFETQRYGQTDRRTLGAIADGVRRAKTHWELIAAGEQPEGFGAALGTLRDAIDSLGIDGASRLATAWGEAARHCLQSGTRPPEELMLEVAASLLFAEQAYADGLERQADLNARSTELAERIQSSLAGKLAGRSMPQWLLELTNRAHERATMRSFVEATRSRLNEVEQMLDTYFRDPSRKQDLAPAAEGLREIGGVLSLVGSDMAPRAAQSMADQVQALETAKAAKSADFERIAGSLGVLGLYVDSLLRNEAPGSAYEFDEQRGEFRLADVARAKASHSPAEPPGSAEARLTELTHHLIDALRAAAQTSALPDDLAAQLRSLGEAAQLVDDSTLVGRVSDTLQQFEAGQLLNAAAVARSLQLSGDWNAGSTDSPLAQSDASAQPGSESDTDTELLEIFLEEAREVLQAIVGSSQCLRSNPANENELTTLRRGYHTLKGSSRMVGLEAFGEVSWQFEQLINHWIADGREADPAFLALIEASASRLVQWVAQIGESTAAVLDCQRLVAAATAMRDGDALIAGPWFDEGPVEAEAVEAIEAEAVEAETVEAETVEAETVEAETVEVEAEDVAVLALQADGPEQADRMQLDSAPTVEPQQSEESPALPVLTEAFDDSPDAVAAAPNEVRVGERWISAGLYQTFIGEADQIIAVLGDDLREWKSNTRRAASESARRSMHSLKGSSAIVGLDSVNRMAVLLERFLLQQGGGVSPGSERVVGEYGDLLDMLAVALHRFAAGQEATLEKSLLERAESLTTRWQERALIAATESPASGPDTEVHEEAITDDLDPELLPIFVEEAADQLPEIGAKLHDWLEQPDNQSLARLLMRLLHTVKGSARMAGAMRLGQRVHEMETRIEAAIELSSASIPLIEDLLAEHDTVTELFEQVRNPGRPAATPTVVAAADSVPDDDHAASPDSVAPAQPVALAGAVQSPADSVINAQSMVRVRADLLEQLVNESGEVSIARSRLDNSLGAIRQSLWDLTENVARLRAQLREIEIQAETQIQSRIAAAKESHETFDPLEFDRYTRFQELTRMLAESVNDVATVQHNATRSLDDAGQNMVSQGQVLRALQQNLMRIRMIRFGTLGDRLYRVVRQSAKELGKRVSLDIRGSNVEVDRSVLERMAGPIEHLLRNAVAHGIESPEQRAQCAKPDAGEISLSVRREGNEVLLELSDDGSGLNLERIRERAIEAGLLGQQDTLSEQGLAEMIFRPGFSTAVAVSEISGRGVGMDVVRAEVGALGGRVDVSSINGQGTRFVVHLPLTLAIAHVVLVTVGTYRFALPSSSVEQVIQLKPRALAKAYSEQKVDWQGDAVPLHYLGALVDVSDQQPIAQHYSPIVVMRASGRRIAVHVDAVTRNQEVVVKNVGPQVARVRGVGGATILGNGEIVLILNIGPLAAAMQDRSQHSYQAAQPVRIADAPPTVMVVDDSLTVRKATQRLLQRERYEVMLAKDGVDALRQLQERVPDAMLVDIEMPRMDGFDLTRHVRGDARYRHVPIVMISSRTADKHQNYARSIGVNHFLGKPYPEDELLSLLAGYMAARVSRESTG